MMSVKVRRASRAILPMARATSIVLPGPSAMKATARMTSNSGVPMPKKFTVQYPTDQGNVGDNVQGPVHPGGTDMDARSGRAHPIPARASITRQAGNPITLE